jgi:hypothetical protein
MYDGMLLLPLLFGTASEAAATVAASIRAEADMRGCVMGPEVGPCRYPLLLVVVLSWARLPRSRFVVLPPEAGMPCER